MCRSVGGTGSTILLTVVTRDCSTTSPRWGSRGCHISAEAGHGRVCGAARPDHHGSTSRHDPPTFPVAGPFGLASGWLQEEIRNHRVQPSQRWDIMREHLMAMKQMWTHEEAEFTVPTWTLIPSGCGRSQSSPRIRRSWSAASAHAAEYGDESLPVVTDSEQLEANLAKLRRACERVGHPSLSPTACLYETDERLIARCAALGVARCAIRAPTYACS